VVRGITVSINVPLVKELLGHRHITTTPDLQQAPAIDLGERQPSAGDFEICRCGGVVKSAFGKFSYPIARHGY
jgi:hypothetical protein